MVKANKASRAGQALEKSRAIPPTRKCVLRLFVAGATARSRQAVLHVRQLCEAELKDNFELEVIDIYQQPNLARDHRIVATPTLVKECPRPMRRFIGNLLNITGLFVELNLITKGRIGV
jgi:circadian clock protein KaiB